MSGRRSKKNQRLGSSRRGPKGLNSNIEKDEDGFQQIAESEDGQNESDTSTDYHSIQFDLPPSSSIDQQTSALECPPHAMGHKDSLMENELPERKRKMGSTRKSTGRFKVERKLDEMRTTGELDEEYVTQPNTSTTEEQHASLTEEEQSRSMSFPSDLSLQTKSSGLGKETGTTHMFAVLENEEKDAIHYQEITSHSHEVVSDMPIDEAMVPSVHSIAVTVAESDLLWKDSVMFDEPSHQEILIASTSGQKRRMGSTRRPLGGKNSENVGVQEHSRNMTENESKAEVIAEAKFTMSEEMAQTWDDVARDVSSSHTESTLVLNQSLLAERAELKEPDVSAGSETMNQSVAFPLVDSEKPQPETSSHHGTPLLNEGLDFKFGSHTEDFVNKVWKKAGSNLSDNSQHVPDTRKDTNTSYNFRDVNAEAKEEVLKQKEELSISDQMSSLLPKQDAQLEELALNDQEYSLSQHDIATVDNNCDCSMAQLIVGGSRSFDVPVPDISHAEPTATSLPHEMSDAVDETQEIHVEIKQESNVCDVASVTCVTLTDLECIMEENEDPQILAVRENENTSDQRGSETDNAFEITEQGDVRDHNVTQIIMDVRDNEKDGETSTETIWISHQKPCEVSAEKAELYREQEQYSSNISQTHSPLQDDAGKMQETDEVRKGKKETENAAGNDVTTESEEMFSFKVSAIDKGSHAHQQLFMQSPDKEGYDTMNEKSEKEEILFSVESENAAFDRGDGRSEGPEGIKEMDAEPVVISDVDTVYNDSESENPEQNRELTEEQIDTSSDTNLQVLQVSDNDSTLFDSGLLLHNVVISSGERETVPEESDISSFIPEDSQDSYKPTTFYPESQENTADSERAAVGGDTDLHLEIEAQNKTFNSTTSEAEGTEENIRDPCVLMREVEVIGDTDTVESDMTTESDFHQTSDVQMETLKVSTNAEKEVSGETDTILKQSDINIIPEVSHRKEAHSKSSPVIHKRKMGSTRRTLKGNKGQRQEHDEKEIFSLEGEPSPEESRYTAVSFCDISESQTLPKTHAGSQENTEDVEILPAEGDTERHLKNKTLDSTAFGREATEENICEASVLIKEVEFIGDTVTVESNVTTGSDLIQNDTSSDVKLEALKVSDNAECEVQEETDVIPKQSDSTIIPEYNQREEAHSEFTVIHKRKMGSTRRPLKGNKGQRKVRIESEEKNGDSEVLSEEEDTETHLEIQNQDNVVDHNVTQEIMNIRDIEDEERKTTKTVDMSVQELCDDLELEQRSDVSQTQTGPSQDDTGSHLLEVPERTADFVRDRFACRSHSDLVLSEALLIEETQNHVSSEDVPPTEMAEMHPVSKRSMQKRKMGSTRKRGKRMVNDVEVEEEKEGEAENTTNDDRTTKSEENLTIEEVIAGSPEHQQLFSSSADKEGHEIQDIGSKSDVQTEISEQNNQNSAINPDLLIESECSSNVAAEMVSDLPLGDVDTYLGPKQCVIPKESHREYQSSLNPVVQKRKMGSTCKTLRGNKGQGKEVESKKMDRDREEMTQEQDTEPHLATSARKTECKFDEEIEQNFPVEFAYPVASSKMFPESENGVKECSPSIHDLSEVSAEKGMESTGNDSNRENEAITLYDGTKDKFVLTVSHEDVDQTVSVDYIDQHVYIRSEPELTENTGHVFPTQELKNTPDDVVHEISSTQKKRRKMGSTRRNPRVMHGKNMADNEDVLGVAEDRETKKAEDDLDDMPLASNIIQSKEVSSVSTTDLESEMLGSATDLKEENDHQNNSEPSRPTVPETPENTLQLVNADVTKHPQSETVTTDKRRKMGSTRKNLREGRIQGKRDGYEETETADTNLQMSQDSEVSLGEQTTHNYSNQLEDSLLSEIERALNKTSQSSMSNDLESIVKEPNPDDIANAPDLNMPENSEIRSLQPTPLAHSEPNSPGRRRRKMGSTRKNPRQQLKAESEDEDKEDGEKDENLKTNKQENKELERVEVSIVHNITENKLNKEYLDVSSAHTSSSQLEESTNSVSQERTSPSTKRKFGSRRANKGKQGLGSLATSDFGNELEDGDHKPDSSEVEDKLRSDDLAVCDPCLTLQPESQPITHPVSEQRNMEAKNEEAAPKGTGAGLVSLDQIIQHDRSTGAKQTVNFKNRISDAEVVQFNVVMVGNSCVGKTSFIRRFHEGQFTEDYRSTIGVDTCIQTIALPDRTVKLQIWDTAGQERFHSITTHVFHKADGLLLMYDITCSNSFISVRDWISRAQERAPDDVIMMLLGNKNDTVERAVQIQEGADLAREFNINFMECSAATGANVSESMRTLAELLVQRKSQKERQTTLRREPLQKKSGCC